MKLKSGLFILVVTGLILMAISVYRITPNENEQKIAEESGQSLRSNSSPTSEFVSVHNQNLGSFTDRLVLYRRANELDITEIESVLASSSVKDRLVYIQRYVELSPERAFRYIHGIAGNEYKRQDLVVLFRAWLIQDEDTAIKNLMTLEDEELLSRISLSLLSVGDWVAGNEVLLKAMLIPEDQELLVGFELTQLPIAEAFAGAMLIEDENRRISALSIILNKWFFEISPAAAITRLNELDEPRVVNHLIFKWANANPEVLLNSLRGMDSEIPDIKESISILSNHDPEAVFLIIEKSNWPDKALSRAINLHIWLEKDVEAATVVIQGLLFNSEIVDDSVLTKLAQTYLVANAPTAERWMQEYISEPAKRRSISLMFIEELIKTNTHASIELMENSDDLAKSILMGLTREMANSDAQGAMDFLDQHKDIEGYELVLSQTIFELEGKDLGIALTSIMKSNSPSRMRQLGQVLSKFDESNEEVLENWMQQQDKETIDEVAFLLAGRQSSVEKSVAMLNRISDENRRAKAMLAYVGLEGKTFTELGINLPIEFEHAIQYIQDAGQ